MIRGLIVDIFGTYVPYTYTDADSVDVIASGMAGVDWPWVFGAVFFAITLYCVFRIIGGAFKK